MYCGALFWGGIRGHAVNIFYKTVCLFIEILLSLVDTLYLYNRKSRNIQQDMHSVTTRLKSMTSTVEKVQFV